MKPSSEIFNRLLRGEASSAEYVAAVRSEAREAVEALRHKKQKRDTASTNT